MSKGLPRSLARAPGITSPIKKVRIAVNASLVMSNVGGAVEFSSVSLGKWPSEGNILFLGAVANLQFTTTSANMITGWTGTFGIGTVATVDNALATTEIDLVGITAMTAVGGTKTTPVTRGVATSSLPVQQIIDNTANDQTIKLNATVADASISGASTVVATGELIVSFVTLGDD